MFLRLVSSLGYHVFLSLSSKHVSKGALLAFTIITNIDFSTKLLFTARVNKVSFRCLYNR